MLVLHLPTIAQPTYPLSVWSASVPPHLYCQWQAPNPETCHNPPAPSEFLVIRYFPVQGCVLFAYTKLIYHLYNYAYESLLYQAQIVTHVSTVCMCEAHVCTSIHMYVCTYVEAYTSSPSLCVCVGCRSTELEGKKL